MGNQLFENRPELDQGKIKENFKILLKGCADLALLNKYISHGLDMMKQECYMASINLKDTYYSVPIALSDQKYLFFQFEEVRYKYACMPNGLSFALRIFTKLLKPVLSTLRKQEP